MRNKRKPLEILVSNIYRLINSVREAEYVWMFEKKDGTDEEFNEAKQICIEIEKSVEHLKDIAKILSQVKFDG